VCSDGCKAIRAAARSLNLTPEHGVTVRLTGPVPLSDEEFATLNKSLHRLERFWTDQILYRL